VSYNLSFMRAITSGLLKGKVFVFELDGHTDENKDSITTANNCLDAYAGLKWWMVKDKIGCKLAVGKRLSEHSPDVLGAFGFVSYF